MTLRRLDTDDQPSVSKAQRSPRCRQLSMSALRVQSMWITLMDVQYRQVLYTIHEMYSVDEVFLISAVLCLRTLNISEYKLSVGPDSDPSDRRSFRQKILPRTLTRYARINIKIKIKIALRSLVERIVSNESDQHNTRSGSYSHPE